MIVKNSHSKLYPQIYNTCVIIYSSFPRELLLRVILVFRDMHFCQDLPDLEVDFYSLLFYVLIIQWSTHNLASTGNIKYPLPLNFKLWLFLKIALHFWQICQICLSWKTQLSRLVSKDFAHIYLLTSFPPGSVNWPATTSMQTIHPLKLLPQVVYLWMGGSHREI